jgi:hypothetical protein
MPGAARSRTCAVGQSRMEDGAPKDSLLPRVDVRTDLDWGGLVPGKR